ncbi:MAG: hypothetical protein ABGW78_04360 [Pirellulales bacterium]
MVGIQRCDLLVVHWIVVVALLAASIVGCEQITSSQAVDSESGHSVASQIQDVQSGHAHQLVAAEPFVADNWNAIRGLKGLKTLVLTAGAANDSDVEVIATLPDIQRLVLRHSPLSDKGMKVLSHCRTLRDVNVPQAACSSSGLRLLGSLPHLQHLRIGASTLRGPEVCEAVVTLSHLRTLHLIDIDIGDEGLDVLSGRPDLWSLYLDGAGVSDVAWERYFEKCPNVHVHIDQRHHDRDPLVGHEQ